MNKLVSFLLCCTLFGCSREFVESIYDVDYTTTNRFAKNLADIPESIDQSTITNERDVAGFGMFISGFASNIERRWGAGSIKYTDRTTYVKYIDDYRTRSLVDFYTGTIRIETVYTENYEEHLKKGIITTLLTPDDPDDVDIFSSKDIILSTKTPFLYRQVLDHNRKPINSKWQASKFADYLISYKSHSQKLDFRDVHYIEINMVQDQQSIRGKKYYNYIYNSSNKYAIQPKLIYSIIKVESDFNPYAKSEANAYGLMQVVPKTAGKDVFHKIKHKKGQPSYRSLLNPRYNIDIGTAYLFLLKNEYLKEIRNPISKEYSIISAYNGGASNVFRTFDRKGNKNRAIKKINSMQPQKVYEYLIKKHPALESRGYLKKVIEYKKHL